MPVSPLHSCLSACDVMCRVLRCPAPASVVVRPSRCELLPATTRCCCCCCCCRMPARLLLCLACFVHWRLHSPLTRCCLVLFCLCALSICLFGFFASVQAPARRVLSWLSLVSSTGQQACNDSPGGIERGSAAAHAFRWLDVPVCCSPALHCSPQLAVLCCTVLCCVAYCSLPALCGCAVPSW